MLSQDSLELHRRFKSLWTNTLPYFGDNQPNVDPPPTGHVHFSVRPGYSEMADSETLMQLGRVWLQVFVPMQGGSGIALQALDQFIAIFRNWQTATGLTVRTPDVGAPMPQPGSMVMYSVSIPYESFRAI